MKPKPAFFQPLRPSVLHMALFETAAIAISSSSSYQKKTVEDNVWSLPLEEIVQIAAEQPYRLKGMAARLGRERLTNNYDGPFTYGILILLGDAISDGAENPLIEYQIV